MESLKQEQVTSTSIMIGNFFMENWTKEKVHTVMRLELWGQRKTPYTEYYEGLRKEFIAQ